MSSTYSTLKFELIGTGDQAGTWGATTNSNIGTAIEQAIAGTATCVTADFTSNVATYTLLDSNVSQTARAYILNVTATLTAAGTINLPAISKPYIVINNSVGGFAITVKVSGQTGVSIPNGKRTMVYNNATDVGIAMDYLPTLALGTALPLTSGGTGQTTANAAFNALAPSQASASGKYLKSDGTNTSWDQIDISTADITGTLPIANGGTGATTAATARTGLGATTLGGNLFTITNPSAVTFPRFNADNTVSALNAADFRTAIGAGTGGGSVTGVTATAPVASSGGAAPDISLNAGYGDTLNPYASKTQNYFLASPNGASGVPTFRAIVAADIPTLNQNTTGSAATATNLAGGAANRIAFQSATATTGFISAPGIANSFLTWDGTNFGWSTTTYGTIPVTSGGTGKTSWTSGTLPYNNGTTSFASADIYYDGTNMGLGYAAEAWAGVYRVFRVGQTGHFFQDGGTTFGTTYVVNNAYFDGTNWVRNYAGNAPTSYRSYGGAHIFGYAASGSAGTTFASFTDVATISSLGISLTTGNFVGNLSGNATTATSATSATSATTATSATKVSTTNFTIEESGGKLIFKYGGTTIASLTSAGVFTALSNVVSNGTP